MSESIDRRQFLASVAATAALACTGTPRAATGDTQRAAMSAAPAQKVGIQLYTLRRDMQADFEGTLQRVAEIGYREVEFAGYFGRTPASVRATLTRLSLTSPAAHVGTPGATLKDIDSILAGAKEIGQQWVVCPWIDQNERTADHYRRHADMFNRIGEAARREGIRFAYHNHEFEFVPTAGVLPYDLLLENTDPNLVDFELDVFWIQKGGHDALAYFDRYPGRFPMLHIKDMDRAGNMVAVGDGAIDFAGILARRTKGGVKHLFVEHDDPGADAFASVRRSYEHLAGIVSRELR